MGFPCGVLLIGALIACSTARAPIGSNDAAIDAPAIDGAADAALDASAEPSYGELCGNALDDDGDGLADEDCGPSLFGGVYAPAVATDPALDLIEGAAHRPLAVLQTYHSTSPAGVANIAPDLAAIFARGQVAHLNLEPMSYARTAYATPGADPIAHDLAASGEAIAGALAAAPSGRVLLTFGAEMNGSWTPWGCLAGSQFVALYRAAHGAVTAALDAHGIDHRRVRWAWGPDSRGSSGCGNAASFYPGHAYVDLIGLSAYRSGSESVEATVITPMVNLFTATAMPAAWQRDRFVVLQTGSRNVSGDADRSAWIAGLWSTLAADPRVAGVIYFDGADWAVPTNGAGWSGLTSAIAGAPIADRGLDGVFLPHFRDVAYGDPGFAEIQALRDAGVTSGCAASPAAYCPDAPLDRHAAGVFLDHAFALAGGTGESMLCAPECGAALSENQLADAVRSLGGEPPQTTDAPITRRVGAIVIARAAKLAPKPL